MSEGLKTLVYIAAATVVLTAALGFRYLGGSTTPTDPDELGKMLFEDFTDPLRSLEISRYDDVTNAVNRFSVNQTNGAWVIPSHSNYPADAEEQMKNAATSLIGREILEISSDDEGDHEDYGVIQPNAEKLESGASGVGVMISMKDDKGKPLAELIVGKADKDNPKVRFVRMPGKPRVYAVEIDLEKLTTRFEDWIDKDLLQLDTFNIDEITFNDYSMEVAVDRNTGQQFIVPDRRMRMTVDKSGDQWRLNELIRYGEQSQPIKVPLAAGEELDTARINDMTSSLDKLEIVDVRRKPAGLGADLKADQGAELSPESQVSLQAHGFFTPTRRPGDTGPIEFFSKSGDLSLQTRDGVEYLLRFGDLAVSQDTSDIDKLNRYLMVAARVAEDRFPKPPMPELPPLPDATPPQDKKDKADDNKAADNEGADNKDEAAKQDGDNKPDNDASADDKPAEDAKSDDAKADDVKADDKKTDADDEPDVDRVAIQLRRDELLKQYELDLDAWKQRRKIAADKVRELNARFGDWYYVIPEDVYKQVHLGRAELIKESENVAEEGFGIDAFRLLEQSGPRTEPPRQPGGPPTGIPGLPNL